MAWVIDFFYKETKSKNKKEKNIFFVFCVGEGVVSDFFFTKNRNLHIFFFFLGGGGGMEGVVCREGSVARVSEFFIQIIQI